MQIAILCGGKSSRMQSEKGLVLYKGKPFVEHIIEAALPISKNIKLITNGNDYEYLKYPKIKDIEIDKGPIGGIFSALANSETELNMILSCDIPLISTEILLELTQKHKSDFEASVFRDDTHIHPLIGIYSKNTIPILKKSIADNDLKLMNLVSKIKHQLIEISNENQHQFRNINSISELNQLINH